jgi:hypothetical protein
MKLAGLIRVPTLAALLTLALLAPGPGIAQKDPAPRKAWDQADVVRLAGDLQSQCNAIRKAFRREPVYTDQSMMKQRSAQRMDQVLRDLERSARQLKTRADGGGGYDETVSIARKIGTLLRDAGEEGRRLSLGEFTNKEIRPAMQTLNELAPYFGSGPLYEVDDMKATENL